MGEQGMTRFSLNMQILVLVAVSLCGCRSRELSMADNKVLFDTNGCAYHIEPGVGDNSFVERLADSDKSTCVKR